MAITLVIVNAICAAVVGLWPDATITVFNSFAYRLDFRVVKSTEPLVLGRFLLGSISVGVIGVLIGFVFAWSHNLLNSP